MQNSDYSFRIKTFKNARVDGKLKKWRHKNLSMAAMARSFYIFDPCKTQPDRVKCVHCSFEASNLEKFKGHPLELHAHCNKDCFVSLLGQAVSSGSITDACLASFKNSNLGELAVQVANQGFYYLPHSEDKPDTVGCIECFCFPQNARNGPEHTDKCSMKSRIRYQNSKEESKNTVNRTLPEASTPLVKNSTAVNQISLDAAKRVSHQVSPTGVKSVLDKVQPRANGYNGANGCDSKVFDVDILSPTRLYAPHKAKPVYHPGSSRDLRIKELVATFQSQAIRNLHDEFTKITNDFGCYKRSFCGLYRAEEAIIRYLQLVHAQQMNLLRAEIECMISQIIAECSTNICKI